MNVVLITGSSSGLGMHLVGVFLAKGYRVAASARNMDLLRQKAEEEKWPSNNLLLLRLDVTSGADWSDAVSGVLSKWKSIDILLNVSGYLQAGRVYEQDEEEIHRHIDTNVKGLMLGCRLLVRQMIQQRSGHIINIASTAALSPVPGLALYSASKFAVRAFSIALAKEVRPLGIRVSVLCPDAIETPMLKKQENAASAALTFSGGNILSVNDVSDAILHHFVHKKKLEYGMPKGRAFMAKVANIFPERFSWIERYLKHKGRSAQRKRSLRQDRF